MKVLHVTPEIRQMRVTGVGENHVDFNNSSRWVGAPADLAAALHTLATRISAAADEWVSAPEDEVGPFDVLHPPSLVPDIAGRDL